MGYVCDNQLIKPWATFIIVKPWTVFVWRDYSRRIVIPTMLFPHYIPWIVSPLDSPIPFLFYIGLYKGLIFEGQLYPAFNQESMSQVQHIRAYCVS